MYHTLGESFDHIFTMVFNKPYQFVMNGQKERKTKYYRQRGTHISIIIYCYYSFMQKHLKATKPYKIAQLNYKI